MSQALVVQQSQYYVSLVGVDGLLQLGRAGGTSSLRCLDGEQVQGGAPKTVGGAVDGDVVGDTL